MRKCVERRFKFVFPNTLVVKGGGSSIVRIGEGVQQECTASHYASDVANASNHTPLEPHSHSI